MKPFDLRPGQTKNLSLFATTHAPELRLEETESFFLTYILSG